MIHLSGYYESVDQGGALAAIAAMADPVLTINGDNIRVPAEMPNICGAALLTAASTLSSAQLQSPSLRENFYPDLAPLVNADDFADPIALPWYGDNPFPLVVGEDLQFLTNTDNSGAVAIQGLLWFSDGVLSPVQGAIRTIKATAAISLTAGTWTNGALTFTQVLPVGDYQVVGMRAEGANLQAARLVYPGGGFRPGVPAVNAVGDSGFAPLRMGRGGSLGTFNSTAPPTLDALGHTDSAQTVYLDLIKVG